MGLLVVHLSTETNGSDAFRAGEVLPIAIGSAFFTALFAGGTWRGRRGWPWWLIALSVLVMSSLWYLAVEVFPRVGDDLEAERSGEADYSVTTPAMAGDWRRLDSESAQAREKASLAGIGNAPDDVADQVDAVYGEYQLKDKGRLFFLGLNASRAFQDELRESSRSALRSFLAGSGIEDPEEVDAGELGGTMACDDDPPGMPAEVVFCGWADGSTVGQVTLVVPGVDVDAAAEITREFREAVTTR